MNSAARQEVEVKLRVPDPGAVRRRLARLKMRPAPRGRTHARNTLFDTPQGGLAKHGQLLRIRIEQAAGKPGATTRAVLTYKGPAVPTSAASRPATDKTSSPASGRSSDAARAEPFVPHRSSFGKRYKVREELEVSVADPEQLRLILEALGLRGWFRYEKYRTSFQLAASLKWSRGLKLELDETPIGVFLELEGPPEAIDRTARMLGYGPADYITKSYLALYLEHCRKMGLPARDMVFSAKKKLAEPSVCS